jgi:hypothetical protein
MNEIISGKLRLSVTPSKMPLIFIKKKKLPSVMDLQTKQYH